MQPRRAHAAGSAAPASVVLQFNEVDAQAAALHGWHQDYLQISCGKFQGALQLVNLGALSLFAEHISTSIYQQGYLGENVIALGVALPTDGQSTFCGLPSQSNSIHVFSGRTGFEFRTHQNHTMLGLQLEASLAQHFTEHDFAQKLTQSGAGQRCPDRPLVASLRDTMLSVLRAARQSPRLLSMQAVTRQMEDHLLETVAQLHLENAALCHAQNSSSARSLVHRARELAKQALAADQVPTVAQLCQQLAVSRRTLQYAFQRCLGVTPLTWLRALRLAAVRLALRQSSSVTESATSMGFWHFGHFAHEYQKLFGELPSQTLKRHERPQQAVTAISHPRGL